MEKVSKDRTKLCPVAQHPERQFFVNLHNENIFAILTPSLSVVHSGSGRSGNSSASFRE